MQETLGSLPRRARGHLRADQIRAAYEQVWWESKVDLEAASRVSGVAAPVLGQEPLLTDNYSLAGTCPVARILDAPLPKRADEAALIGSDGSTTVGATVRVSTSSGVITATSEDRNDVGRIMNTTRMPFPPYVGDVGPTARFTELQGATRLVLECEAAGVGNGVMDAQSEWHTVMKVDPLAARRQLNHKNVAGARRSQQFWQR